MEEKEKNREGDRKTETWKKVQRKWKPKVKEISEKDWKDLPTKNCLFCGMVRRKNCKFCMDFKTNIPVFIKILKESVPVQWFKFRRNGLIEKKEENKAVSSNKIGVEIEEVLNEMEGCVEELESEKDICDEEKIRNLEMKVLDLTEKLEGMKEKEIERMKKRRI